MPRNLGLMGIDRGLLSDLKRQDTVCSVHDLEVVG